MIAWHAARGAIPALVQALGVEFVGWQLRWMLHSLSEWDAAAQQSAG